MPLERTKNFIRQRLKSPSLFNKRSFRTVKSGSHEIVVGRLKGLKVTTAQSILHPRTEKHSKSCPKCRKLRRMF